MTILHVTDFHFNQRWFDWLLHRAPPHDFTALSGDLLDLAAPASHRRQIAWVTEWLNNYPRPLGVCSGNHDLEWDSVEERWLPAYWLREVTNPNVRTDGWRVHRDGVSFLSIGCTTRPKGAPADVWIVHAPPSSTLVARRAVGGDAGDPELLAPAQRHAPRLVLCGHVHQPLQWHDEDGSTLYLNPGRAAEDTPFPNHILVETASLSCRFVEATDAFGARRSRVWQAGGASDRGVGTQPQLTT